MTLVLGAAAGAIVTGQFGVNEIASAITVGRFVGSILSRSQDAKILDIMASLNNLEMQGIPEWLTGIATFTRRATIYGDRMRKITASNILSDVEMSTPEGLATLIALVLRYVQTPEQAADMVANLLRGSFGLLIAPFRGPEESRPSIPYSAKSNLIKIVKSVWDSDKDSDQNAACLQWLSELSSCIGQSVTSSAHTANSLAEQQRFLKCLLAPEQATEQGHQRPYGVQTFHTLSAGAAMIALAARAQGAHVQLDCVMPVDPEHVGPQIMVTRQIPPASNKPVSLQVKLWLIQPPREIREKMPGLEPITHLSTELAAPQSTVFGGAAEISSFVAAQLGAFWKLEYCLKIWNEGFNIGKRAIWSASPKISLESVGNVYIGLGRQWLDGDRGEYTSTRKMFSTFTQSGTDASRSPLFRNAMIAVHRALQQKEYPSTTTVWRSLELAVIAIAVGCVRSQIDDHSQGHKLESFAWTFDARGRRIEYYLGLARNDSTISHSSSVSCRALLALAGSIWGGLLTSHHPQDLSDNLLGLVCPQGTLMYKILEDPQTFVKKSTEGTGLQLQPLLSFFKGSAPLLPQDLIHGTVVGGNSTQSLLRTPLDTICANVENNRQEAVAPPVLTLETMATGSGQISMIVCAWLHGDVIAELNPATIFSNIISRAEPIPADEFEKLEKSRSFTMETSSISPVYISSWNFFSTPGRVYNLRIRHDCEWQALIAGLGSSCTIVDAHGLDAKLVHFRPVDPRNEGRYNRHMVVLGDRAIHLENRAIILLSG